MHLTSAQSGASASPISGSHTAAVRILVIGHAADNLRSMQLLLARPDIAVLTAGSAATALEVLEQHDIALVLLDVQMPEGNGFDLAERMRLNDKDCRIPVIFMSDHVEDPSLTLRGYEVGAVDVLLRPFDPIVLECKVRFFAELYRRQARLSERNGELERMLHVSEATARDLRRAHSKAVEHANVDDLTGVSNRRHIFQKGEATLADRRRDAQPLSLAIFDLDHFKSINDTYGHQAGDGVLRAFCLHVSRQIRPSHMLGRIGGEEFLLLMPGTSLDEAKVILERLHDSLESHASVSYTFSAGVAQACTGERLHAVVARADAALYGAKRAGRDCSVTSPAPL